MRNIVIVKPPRGTNVASMHARYLSERERNPNREEPDTRPLFTHDRDGLKHTAADRYLAGGESARSKPHDLMHVIISFNAHDRRELEKLERAAAGGRPKTDRAAGESKKEKASASDRAEILQAQLARDLPYAQAIRLMMKNIEERTDHSELRYALTVHRHTGQTHVHLLLRREHTDKRTGEKIYFDKKGLPEEFVNGRDERSKARAGLIDRSLSDALDTMIPQRRRTLAQTDERREPEKTPELSSEKTDQLLTVEHEGQKPPKSCGQFLDTRSDASRQPADVTRAPEAKTAAEHHPHPAITLISVASRMNLAPRYSTTRKQTAPDTQVVPGAARQNHQPTQPQALSAPAGEILTGSQTAQLLTPTVQLLDQILSFRRFSNDPDKASGSPRENKFSAPGSAPTRPADEPHLARPVNAPIKQLVTQPRQDLVPVHEKPARSHTRSR